jgi:superfamily I DNA/RNA helicase
MFFLFILAIASVWLIYSTVGREQETPKRTRSPVIRNTKRLVFERIIQKIAGDVSEEKMSALSIESPNALITARAGSGKTMAIAIKLALAVRTGTKPEQTLALCFNRSAAMELGRRIATYGVKDAPTATFHSLAYAIVHPKPGSLIFGESQHALMRTLLTGKSEKREKEAGVDPIDELVVDVLTFISSVKHKGLSASEVWARCNGLGDLAAQVASLYAAYTNHLSAHGLMDFNDLIVNATVKLRTLPRLPVIRLNGNTCDLNTLRLVCLDEFQDLSPAFYGLVKALMEKNPGMQTYCVGDDFQAVNGFCGSDLKYFQRFETFFPDAKRSQLRANYRSGSVIVEYANKHMRGLGEGGHAIRQGGSVEHVRASERIHDAICERVTRERGRSVLVLARRNTCHGKDLTVWQAELSRLHSNVRVSTIHKSKGGEADVVLFLKEPDTRGSRLACLNGLLGLTDEETEAEERRLTYVGLTRARGKLVIVE